MTPLDDRGDRDDRRFGPRIPVGMWVESTPALDGSGASVATSRKKTGEVYFQRSANLSTGGIYFDSAIPQPLGTRVTLEFTLPGDTARLRVRGEVVNRPEGSAVGMGVKFVDLDEAARARIERFVAAHVAPGSASAQPGSTTER